MEYFIDDYLCESAYLLKGLKQNSSKEYEYKVAYKSFRRKKYQTPLQSYIVKLHSM